MLLLKMIKHLWEMCSWGKKKKKKMKDLTYIDGESSVVWLETQESFLILDFQGLMPAQAAAVTVSEITNPCWPALFLATDLLLPLFHPAVLFLALCRAVLCPVWGEPGSCRSWQTPVLRQGACSVTMDNTCASKCLCCLHNWEVSHSSSLFKAC